MSLVQLTTDVWWYARIWSADTFSSHNRWTWCCIDCHNLLNSADVCCWCQGALCRYECLKTGGVYRHSEYRCATCITGEL